MTIRQLFHTLEGTWTIHRFIPGHGEIIGSAHFQKLATKSNLLHYREEGTFHLLNGKSHRVFRDYLYQLNKGQISVFFAEKPPRLFHTLKFINPSQARGTHICKCDHYDTVYQFDLPKIFSITHRIMGPKKDECIVTIYKPWTDSFLKQSSMLGR